jgi:hypothetical protein
MDKKIRCKNGERRDPKSGECIKMSDDIKKHKQSLRNKKKGVIKDEHGNIIRNPMKRVSRKNKTPIVLPTGSEPDRDVQEELVETTVDQPEEIVEASSSNVDQPEEIVEASSSTDELPIAENEPPTSTNKNELYPTLDDDDFSYKIAQRQEFADTKYDGTIKNIREQAHLLCNSNFELLPHQLFVRNFLSFQTPYNGLLLYHGLGSGKTCSAIGITEEMRAYMKQMGITKRTIIVASPNVQDNFRLQLFDERKLTQLPDGTWNLNTCIGNSLLQEINPTNLRGITRERIISQIRSIIQQSYVFMGNKGEFANYIRKAIHVPEDAGYSSQEIKTLREKKIKMHFNNRLVVLDEIHNIRISDANKTKKTFVLLNEIAKKSDNMRLLLLSATPMYNSYNEIIWLANLLNTNDKRSSIQIEDVFQSNGEWKENGKDLLQRKLTGYISYVRGENPYVFPYRIYPETYSPDRILSRYPSKQMNQLAIEDPIRFIPIYKNAIGTYQEKGYQFIIRNMGFKTTTLVDKQGRERAMPSFENMEKFGYTMLLAPLEALIMVYPNPKLDKSITATNTSENDNEPLYDNKEGDDIIKSVIGKRGLGNIMKFSRIEKPIPKRVDYEYKPAVKKTYGDIFSPENISKYSSKISNICEIIRKPSKGIVLIYSQYIDGGLVPMALALESMGLSRYSSTPDHNRNLLRHGYEGVDSITMKKKGEMSSADFRPARYVMITGEKDFSQNNNEDIKYVTNKENSDGSLVKVILISMAASEGLDFKNIRQIHILEPWYNMNRIEQIVGRGVRNLSHCDLPFEERNVEIYLHGTVLNNDEEAADLYVYRSAEKKAVQIGRVTRVLKEISVDCLLNIGQTNFTEKRLLEEVANQDIRIRLSSFPEKEVAFKIGDKPRTEACDYMDDCEYKCAVRSKNENPPVIKDTYDESFIKTNSVVIMKKIRDLFKEKIVYRRDHLINAINFVKKYPIEHIYYALSRFIQNKNEGLIDKYGRSGYLISRDEFYAFQPSEIMDETISVYERSTPVDYKPVSLRMEVPKEILPWKEEGAATAAAAENTQENKASSSRSRTYEEILQQIDGILKLISKKEVSIKVTNRDWYKYANKVVTELMVVHEMKIEWIKKFVVFHFLDKLPVEEKLVLVTGIFIGERQHKKRNGYENILKLYFDDLILKVKEDGDEKVAVILADGSQNKMFVLDENSRFLLATYTDEKTFASSRKARFIVPMEKINRTEIGFMHPFKEKEVVFKIKDLTQKRNNLGAKCSDASKPSICSKIGAVLNQPSIYSSTQIEKPELCVLLEIIMRWKTESRDIYYFFGPERVNEMKISNLHW